MKRSRLFFTILLVLLAILALTVFLRGVPIQKPSILTLQPSGVDYPQWELPHGAKTRLGKGKINDIKFSSDGTQFAVATTIGVWMYDAKSGKETALFKGDRQDIKGVSFSEDGKFLTGANSTGEILRWNTDDRELLSILANGKENDFYSADFSEDGTKFASTSLIRKGEDILKNVHVWHLGENTTDTPTFSNIDLGIKEEDIRRIALSPNSRFLATAIEKKNKDRAIHVWDTEIGERLITLSGNNQRLNYALAFSPDGTTFASADRNSIHLWNMGTAAPRGTFKSISGFNTLTFSPNGKLLASGNKDGGVTIWNTTPIQKGLGGIFSKYTPTLELKGHKDEVSTLTFSPDGKLLLSGSEDSTIRAWDTNTGRQQFTCSGHSDEISGMATSENGDTIISVAPRQSQIQHWNINTGHQISMSFLKGHVASETISPNAMTLVMKDVFGKKIRLLDISKNRNYVSLKWSGHPKNAFSFVFEFSPDGKKLAIPSNDKQIGVIQLWDIANPPQSFLQRLIFKFKKYRPLFTLKGHTGKVDTLTFAPNGKILASGGDSKEINLWKVGTGDHLFTLSGHKQSTRDIAFSPDRKILASASYSTIYLWDLTTRVQLRKCKTDGGNSILLFSPDGKILVVGGWKGIFQLYDTKTCHLLSTHKGHTSWINKITELVFIEDGKTLASTSSDGTILLWDWEKISQVNP